MHFWNIDHMLGIRLGPEDSGEYRRPSQQLILEFQVQCEQCSVDTQRASAV